MKVLQINKYFYEKGGAETVFFNTMALLEAKGHKVIPFSLKGPKNRLSPYEKYFVDYPELLECGFLTKLTHAGAFVYNRQAARQLERLIQNERPDIAHIHLMFNSLSVAILPILKRYHVPVVMSLHDYRLICPAYTFIDGKGRICERCLKDGGYWHCIARRCSNGNWLHSLALAADSYFRRYVLSPFNYVDTFLFVGEFAQKKHIAVDARFQSKSVVLHNFTAIRNNPTLEAKDNYLLYFGRLSKEKGLPYLIEAMQGLPNVRLKIAGQGPLLKEMSLRCPANIEFVGYKSGNELYDCIRKALFVVVPSVWYENNPMAVIEAFASGTPVIANRIGGVPELIENGKTGFLVKPRCSEALKATIQQALALPSDKYAAMCNAAKAFAGARFTPETYYEKLLATYTGAIEKNKPR